MSQEREIKVDQAGPDKFILTVHFDGQTFDCGTYITRVAALQAGKLFVERKEGEQEGRKKRPRGKR
jgi:hypothetical protein